MNEEKKYEVLLGAIQWRRDMLIKRLDTKYLPENIRQENLQRLQTLEEWRDILFT